MKVLIFEDETLAADRLKRLLLEIQPDAEVLEVVKSIKKGISWLQNNPEPDLILSDIQLLDGVSFDIYKAHPIGCPVIFTTAYDQYALQAFEVNSIDYLLKPIQQEKLQAALQKVNSTNEKPIISSQDLDALMEMIEQRKTRFKSRFLVKLGQKIRSVAVNQILYFYTEDKLTFLVTSQGDKFPVDHSLEELESLLDPDHFFRINRKYTVAVEAIKDIHPYFKGRVKIDLHNSSDDDIVVSSEKTPILKAWLDR